MGKLGSMQDLVRGVEKLTGKNQKAAASGMTKEEKTMVDAMKQSQKRTRALLLSIVFGALLAFGSSLLTLETHFDTIAYDAQGRILTWSGTPRLMLLMLHYGLLGIGLGLSCTYGPRSRAAHWLYLILYLWNGGILCYMGFAGFRAGASLMILTGICGAAALLTALLAYSGKKKALTAHLIMIAAPLILLLVFGLI